MPKTNTSSQIHVLSKKEGMELLDKQAMRYLHMSGKEFIEAWREGKFDTSSENPEVTRVAMLLPLAE